MSQCQDLNDKAAPMDRRGNGDLSGAGISETSGRGATDEMGFWVKTYTRRGGTAGGRGQLLGADEVNRRGPWAHPGSGISISRTPARWGTHHRTLPGPGRGRPRLERGVSSVRKEASQVLVLMETFPCPAQVGPNSLLNRK